MCQKKKVSNNGRTTLRVVQTGIIITVMCTLYHTHTHTHTRARAHITQSEGAPGQLSKMSGVMNLSQDELATKMDLVQGTPSSGVSQDGRKLLLIVYCDMLHCTLYMLQ